MGEMCWPLTWGVFVLRWRWVMVHSVIERLQTDHVSMGSLLDILEREIANVEKAANANFDIMRDVMHYLTRYSDAVHHPMEDLLYARLNERSAEAREQLLPVPVEHARIERESRALEEAVTMVADGGLALREDLIKLGKSYVSNLRRHVELEEASLFPLAKKHLNTSDLEEVAKILAERKDPIFGEVVDADFRNLYEHIRDEA